VRGGGDLVCEDVGQGVDAAMEGRRRRRGDDAALRGDGDGVGTAGMASAPRGFERRDVCPQIWIVKAMAASRIGEVGMAPATRRWDGDGELPSIGSRR
jgi:hypothetical protein